MHGIPIGLEYAWDFQSKHVKVFSKLENVAPAGVFVNISRGSRKTGPITCV